MPDTFDFTARYKVDGEEGIAWRAIRYETTYDEDYDWTGIETINEDRIVAVMIGDDREFEFDTDQLIPIDEDDYCPECGQIPNCYGS